MNFRTMLAVAAASALLACSSDDQDGGGDASSDATNKTDSPAPDGGTTQHVTQTNLFADTSDGGAPNVDPNLVNAWGLAFGPTGVAWVAENGTGLLTLYMEGASQPASLVVTVPPPGGAQGPSTPTGQILNRTSGFMGDIFIASTEDGTVAGWQSGTTATLRVDQSATGAIYKGLAIVPTTPPILVAANFNAGKLDVFDASYKSMPTTGTSWSDPSVPAGFAPFNVAAIEGDVVVTYAMQDADKMDDVAGAGHGAVSVFDQTGALKKSLVATGGVLDSPWGLAEVTNGFAGLPNGALIVGDFGDGTVHAFDMTSGALLMSFATDQGPLAIDGLWSLQFGVDVPDGGATGESQRLYFTAGPNDEANGLFGYLTAH